MTTLDVVTLERSPINQAHTNVEKNTMNTQIVTHIQQFLPMASFTSSYTIQCLLSQLMFRQD